jgi:hypothetical protein
MTLKPIQAGMTLPPTLPLSLPLVRAPRPAQFALGGSALEWQGYRALCSRMQQAGASGSSAAERSKKGPDASTADP